MPGDLIIAYTAVRYGAHLKACTQTSLNFPYLGLLLEERTVAISLYSFAAWGKKPIVENIANISSLWLDSVFSQGYSKRRYHKFSSFSICNPAYSLPKPKQALHFFHLSSIFAIWDGISPRTARKSRKSALLHTIEEISLIFDDIFQLD